MSTRTVEELRTALKSACDANDTAGIEQCLHELNLIGTWEARAIAAETKGLVDVQHGNFTGALEQYQRSLAIYEEVGDKKGIAMLNSSIGRAYNALYNFPLALDHLMRAVALHEELGDRLWVAHDRTGIASVHAQTGDHAAAMEALHASAAFFEEIGHKGKMASTFRQIGVLLTDFGDFSSALEFLHRSHALAEDVGDRRELIRILNSTGVVYGSTSDYPSALEYFHRSLGLVKEIGDFYGEAFATSNLGNVERAVGNYPAALEYYHQALARYEQVGNRGGVARSLMNIGLVHEKTGDYPAALEFFHKSLHLHEELGHRSGVAVVTSNIGNIYKHGGNFSEALGHYERALEELNELGEMVNTAVAMSSITEMLIDMGRVDEARTTLINLDAIPLDVPNVQVAREILRARLHVIDGELPSAAIALGLAREIATQTQQRPELATVHKQLRDLCQKTNDFAGYIEHNNEYTRITEEINGKDTATKLAMQAKQREIDAREKEHQQHMAVLHSTLPKHIADRVARGEVVNDTFDNAAVLFLDVVGFTTHSSELDAGEVVSLLQNIFTTFDAICAEHNVMKIKTIGDSYMAVAFPSEHHIEDLAAVALAMQTSEFTWPHAGERVMFRIGLHCGPVVAGVLGTERMQYDVWGDTVNVASRMESAGEPGKVHVSEAFADNLKSNQESRIKNPILESHEVPLVTRHSSLVTSSESLVTIERGSFDIKGKGMMKTYWLEQDSNSVTP